MAYYFKATCNKPALSYTVNEEIVFDIATRYNGSEDRDCFRFKWQIEQDDGKCFSGEGSALAGRSFTIKTSISRPGFVHLNVTALTPDGEPDPAFDVLDAGAGAEIDKIQFSGNIPNDFDEYWRGIEKLIADFTPELIQKVPHYKDVPSWCDCYDVKISTPIDTWASGYLSIPKGEGPFPIEISYRGYAICGALPTYKKDCICLNLNAHGFENGFENVELERKYSHLRAYGFDKTENERPETTYWQGVIIRDLSAVKWMKTLEKWNKTVLISHGGSQGAFRATSVAAHDKDVTYLDIYIPWFCDLNKENTGYLKGWRPESQNGLDYFDTVVQAMRVKCPINIIAYLGDYICPPSTVMTLYNSINGEKKLTFIQAGTHGYRPIEIEKYCFSDYEVKTGLYRHYKGTLYEVLYVARDSETLEESVVYKEKDGNKIWVRPKEMWNDIVIHENKQCKRFEFIE